MEWLDDLLARAAGDGPDELPRLPSRRLVVLSCMDHRVDPVHLLGLERGEAAVLRNPGGRVTPAFVEQLAILARIFPEAENDSDPFELLLIQHTECGFARISEEPEHAEPVAAYLGVPPERLGERVATDPRRGVRADLEVLAADERVPAALAVTGLVYDLASSRLEAVERRAPLRTGA